MKNLLVLMLSLSVANSYAATSPLSKQRSLRQLVQKQLLRGKATLSSVLVASSLLLTSPAVAQGAVLPPPENQQEANHAEHSSVLNLVLTFAGRVRDSHIVYVGQGHRDRALFLGLRLALTAVPLAEADLLLSDADARLFDRAGPVLRDAKVEEIQHFLRPDAELIRLYDISMLAVEGLDSHAYQAVQIDTFPAPETLLTVVAYRTDLVPEREKLDWWEILAATPLLQGQCQALSVTPALWSAHSNCDFNRMGTTTAPIFTAGGKLVGFYLAEGNIVVIPPQVQTYLEGALVVEAEQKLPLTWGALKKGGY